MISDRDQVYMSEGIELGFSPPVEFGDDSQLVSRIVAAYRLACDQFNGYGVSMWEELSSKSRDIQTMLLDGESAQRILRDPVKHDLLLGFDEACATHFDVHRRRNSSSAQAWGRRILYKLVRLGEAAGVIQIWNPENSEPHNLKLEELLSGLDIAFGFRVDFPNPYPGEYGLITSRGIVDHRSVIALYQAWRMATLVDRGASILEIGAGVGRTAYYARKFGLGSYTIVDLPHTAVAQANWLGRVLGPSELELLGENRVCSVRIVSPSWLSRTAEKFSLVLNGDSFTEMDSDVALSYFRIAAACSKLLVSINHEVNSFRVCDLPSRAGIKPLRFLRYPCWVREGYAEELYFFS